MTQQEAEILDRLRDRFDEFSQQLAAIAANCGHCKERLCGLAREVYGNGSSGLKIRIDRIEQRGQLAERAISLLAGLVGAGAGALATWLGR